MKLGSYVQYKSHLFIVTSIIGDKVKILSPIIGKRFVNMVNVTVTPLTPAKQVTYKDKLYIVTGKDLIISADTNKIMKWKQYHKERVEILRIAASMDKPTRVNEYVQL